MDLCFVDAFDNFRALQNQTIIVRKSSFDVCPLFQDQRRHPIGQPALVTHAAQRSGDIRGNCIRRRIVNVPTFIPICFN